MQHYTLPYLDEKRAKKQIPNKQIPSKNRSIFEKWNKALEIFENRELQISIIAKTSLFKWFFTQNWYILQTSNKREIFQQRDRNVCGLGSDGGGLSILSNVLGKLSQCSVFACISV